MVGNSPQKNGVISNIVSRFTIADVSYRQLMVGTLAAAGITVLFWLLIRFHIILLLFVLGFVISAITQPLVKRLSKYGLTLRQSTAVVFSSLLIMLLAGLSLIIPNIARQSATTASTLTTTYREIRLQLIQQENLLAHRIGFALPVQASIFVEQVMEETEGDTAAEGAAAEDAAAETLGVPRLLDTFSTVFLGAIYTVVVLAIAVHWTIEGERVTQVMLLMVSPEKRPRIEQFILDLQTKVGSYAIAQSILCLVIGAASAVLYTLIGLPNVVVLAVIAGVMEAVPVVGAPLGAIPALIVALSVSPSHALWVILGTIVIQQTENNILVPRIMDRVVGIRPFVTLISLTIFGALFGLLGAVVSIPLTVIIQLIINHFVFNDEHAQRGIVGRDTNSFVRYQLQQLVKDIRQQIRNKQGAITTKNDNLEDSLEQIALELDDFLASQENGTVG